MNIPIFPLIVIDQKFYLDLILSDKEMKVSLNSTNGDTHKNCYDSEGRIWIYKFMPVEDIKKNLWNRVINPLVNVRLVFTFKCDYTLSELKDILSICVDNDDDIITQYEEPEIIKEAINKSQSFYDVLATLNKYIYDINEDEIIKEQEERGILD